MAIFIDNLNFKLEIMLFNHPPIFVGIFTSTHADTKFCGCSNPLDKAVIGFAYDPCTLAHLKSILDYLKIPNTI